MLGFRRLTLTNFRCYRDAEIAVSARPAVLTGPNGAGKTNLLEAVSLFAPGGGLRRAKMADMRRQSRADSDGAGWNVAAQVTGALGPVRLGTGLDPAAGEKRLSRIDGVTVNPGQFADHISLLWLTPQMDRLFLEGASGRRRFFDRLVASQWPDHLRQYARYEQTMRERNRLLDGHQPADPHWLTALEAQMAEASVAIAAARRDGLEALQAAIDAAPPSAFPKAYLALDGESEQALADGQPALAVEDQLAADLASRRDRDRAAGRATVGAHRCDLQVTHADHGQAARLCSTGEQKALLIGLILAQADQMTRMTGHAPILLLDEIAAHLDERRRTALFDRLVDLPAQSWLTGTDRSLFAALEGRADWLRVDDGQVAPDGGT